MLVEMDRHPPMWISTGLCVAGHFPRGWTVGQARCSVGIQETTVSFLPRTGSSREGLPDWQVPRHLLGSVIQLRARPAQRLP
jgi:hypothetical protein